MKVFFKNIAVFLFLFFYSGVTVVHAENSEPPALVLTWQQDPTTTITIDWHTEPEQTASSIIYFKVNGDDEWLSTEAETHPFPFSNRIIHRAELTELDPGYTYQFKVGEFERVYSFETMPAMLNRPLRFAVGGNIMHVSEWMEDMNNQVMNHNPDFIIWGGDLAFAMGMAENSHRWYTFFNVMKETLISDEGKVIPVIAAIGDHETKNQYTYNDVNFIPTNEWRAENAPFFFSLWAFPGHPGYNVLDFGDYLSLIILDSGHVNEMSGQQESWLLQTLAERQHIPHVFPVYHVGGWASVKGLENGPEQQGIHDHFYPAFETYGVRVAFENHDYAYKRTPPMRAGAATDPGNGVVFLGDGAWGVETFDHVRFMDGSRMRPKSERFGHIEVRADGIMDSISDIWYLDAFESRRHFTLATILNEKQHFMVIGDDGDIIDEYTEDDYDPNYVRVPEPHTGRWITDLLVFEGTDWAIEPSIETGKQLYTDYNATLASIPEDYVGLEWIRTATDASGRNQQLASLSVPSDGYIFVAVDDRLSNLPSWLENWSTTDDAFTVNDNDQLRTMNILQMEVEQDQLIELGPQYSSGSLMYIVMTRYATNLISELTVSDGKNWRKVASFSDGRPAFTDESLTVSTVPDKYLGLEWIQTSNASRLSPDSPLASFRINHDGHVYLAVNSLFSSNPPLWLNDWEATGDVIMAGFSFNVYTRSYEANQIVLLGPLRATRGSNYMVLVASEQQMTTLETPDRPAEFILHNNYPNPFNSSTLLRFELPEDGHTTLNIYDPLGRHVTTLVNGYLYTGSHSISFNASALASGIYFFRLESGQFSQVRSMMLIK